MNLLLLQPEDLGAPSQQHNLVTLSDERAKHIRSVLRASIGDTLKVGLLNGLTGNAEIRAISERSVSLEFELHTPPPPKLPLTLLLALPRPKMAKRIIRAATELGVSEIILLNSYRVDKSYWQSPLVSNESLTGAMLEGLEQAGDTILPSINRELRFKPFVEDKLPSLLQHKMGLFAHPYSTQAVPTKITQPSLLAIGPEGGFIPYECEKLTEAGLQGFSLGPRILKTETAVSAIIARLFL
ncbi:Ribosomal RNA small subunit methyltransferase E [Zhongshania aliphaticivorans]|uniref:Ribosomal RNA small subunit methyltransferase E n=1 Tax=Zhongshania aliphaticivorans TaxID=1470434 RepID=A0A5S9N8K7_9GAMM|nr:16S rRNA (uracil(1498)-N(3))-methyltransferase [Zhongshania aliphaticivorans]CAA0079179.1 Ribosomal RNA small subunit methyltransferase E [Zhongshania aliphaticivorans]CAA0086258.1 Ribosomal RNA small subunit methyltransferase E [Zhongshania aliphaticivorans]